MPFITCRFDGRVSSRAFVVFTKPHLFDYHQCVDRTLVVNPRLVSASDEEVSMYESCLSVPGYRGLVKRARAIKVEYTTEDGEPVERELSDLAARLFLHELDHLDGTLYTDRLASPDHLVRETSPAEGMDVTNWFSDMANPTGKGESR